MITIRSFFYICQTFIRKKKVPLVYVNEAAAAVLSNSKRIEDTYRPTTVAGGSWRLSRIVLMPTITEPIFKQNFVPTIAASIVNAYKDYKQEYKLHRVIFSGWFLNGRTLSGEEFRREEIVPKVSGDKYSWENRVSNRASTRRTSIIVKGCGSVIGLLRCYGRW